MMRFLKGFATLAMALLIAGQGVAQTFTPARGSAERTEVLDGLRPSIEVQMHGPVEFVVTSLRASASWAFVRVEPQRPGGRPIDPRQTVFADAADSMDGLTIYALLRFKAGGWVLVDHVVGPTDVA